MPDSVQEITGITNIQQSMFSVMAKKPNHNLNATFRRVRKNENDSINAIQTYPKW